MTLIRFFIIGAHLAAQILRYVCFRTLYLVFFFLWSADARRHKVERLRALCFTDFFRNLGATFIKIGQILSSRPDILPEYLIEELKLLQDHVPPFDFADVDQTLREDFGKGASELFEKFNRESIAAASIAQVHEAWLSTGEHVAVKVRRPNIERTMERDLSVLQGMAWLADKLPYLSIFNLQPQVQSFSEAIRAQLDFRREARNNRRFDENMRHVEWVHFPAIYPEYCSGRVITMEFCTGMKLDQVIENPPIERRELAERLFGFYGEMVFGNQFIHADLHPGNVLIDDRGEYTLLDTGLVVEMPKYYIKRFLRLVFAMASMDGALLLRTYLADREDDPLTPEQLERASVEARALSDQLVGKTTAEIEMGKVILDMFALLRKYHVWMERELTMMFVSDITVEGMVKRLYPEFNIPDFFQRMAMKHLAKMDWLKPEDLIVQHYAKQGVRVSNSAGL